MRIQSIANKHPLVLFCFMHLCVWSILPLLRTGVPMDSLEAIWWGKYCLLGTNKHPPLSGFPAYGIYLLFFENAKAIYFLSQLCVIIGFVYIYKLAQLLLKDNTKAVLSVMILEGCVFYGYCSPEYNVNVLSLALWPMCAYYFYRALIEDKLVWWVCTAVACGLNILNKYTSGLQLLGCVLLILFTAEGRKCLKSYKVYIGVAIFMVMVIPHIYWLYAHDFMVLEYFSERGGKNIRPDWINHIIYPSKFFASLFFYGLGSVLIFVSVFGKKFKNYTDAYNSFNNKFLFWLSIFPIIFIILFGIISGTPIKSMWGYPLLYLLGIVLFRGVKGEIGEKIYVKTQKITYTLMLIMGIAYATSIFLSKSPKYNLDGKNFAIQLTRKWYQHQRGEKKLQYVLGDVWLSSILTLESPDKPKPVIWGDAHRNPWVSAQKLKQEGGIVFAETRKEYKKYTESYPKATAPKEIKFQFSNILGKTRFKRYYYGFIDGE